MSASRHSPGCFSDIAERIDALRIARGDVPAVGFFDQVRELVLIASASRGGSSVFTEFLRQSRSMTHFRGETNAFLFLRGLGHPDSGMGSDVLEPRHATEGDTQGLAGDFSMDVGVPCALETEADVHRFSTELTVRLHLQWPDVNVAVEDVDWAVAQALDTLASDRGWRLGEALDVQAFHAVFIGHLRKRWPQINPYYYDLSRSLIARYCPDAPAAAGPPGRRILEEPPFVTIAPWRRADSQMLAELPLVVKTPSNVYRFDFFRALFPNARLRVMHLTRNAAASINGLYDGWRYEKGFYSHRVPTLSISGYSDVQPGWGTGWWNYDLPPGWADLSDRRLEEVCAVQWRSAHAATLAYLEREQEVGRGALRVRFEDLISESTATSTVREVVSWLGVTPDAPLRDSTPCELPPVMATDKPRHRRWFEKADMLEPVLFSPEIREMMRALGYPLQPEAWM